MKREVWKFLIQKKKAREKEGKERESKGNVQEFQRDQDRAIPKVLNKIK